MMRVNLVRKLAILAALLSSAPAAIAKEAFLPLPDLTEDNLSYQFQRCSAFYSAFSGIIAKTLLETTEPLEMARLQGLEKRAAANSDNFLTSAILVLTSLEDKSDAEAINIAVDNRNGYAILYLQRFFGAGSTFAAPLLDEVWSRDAASCGVIAGKLRVLVEPLLQKK